MPFSVAQSTANNFWRLSLGYDYRFQLWTEGRLMMCLRGKENHKTYIWMRTQYSPAISLQSNRKQKVRTVVTATEQRWARDSRMCCACDRDAHKSARFSKCGCGPWCTSILWVSWKLNAIKIHFSSFHELMQSCGVRRPSVCKHFAQIASSTR